MSLGEVPQVSKVETDLSTEIASPYPLGQQSSISLQRCSVDGVLRRWVLGCQCKRHRTEGLRQGYLTWPSPISAGLHVQVCQDTSGVFIICNPSLQFPLALEFFFFQNKNR